MPFKLVPPKAGRSPNYRIRGTHLGCYCDRSTGTSDRRLAEQFRKRAEREIERGALAEPKGPGFASAAAAYMKAGGDRRFLAPLITHFRNRAIDEITQIEIDDLAASIYPNAEPSTLNRQVYTPISAVLKRAGFERKIKRPKGWRGSKATSWLQPDQAFDLFDAADRIEPEFGLLLRTLCYTGMRIGEALSVELSHLSLADATIYLPRTKNGEPRAVHLPPILIDAFKATPPRRVLVPVKGRRWTKGEGGTVPKDSGVPFLERDPSAKLFRYHQGGPLRKMLAKAMKEVGLVFPPRQRGFHLFCHTYGTWMNRFGGLDTFGLARSGRWKDPRSADRYRHTAPSEEAKLSDVLPVRRSV